MALTAILRRSASMAARVVGTPRHSRHCAAFSAAKLCAANRPNMFHSVSADKKLLEILQSEVDVVVESDDFGKEVDVPSNFPFSLRENSTHLTLTREYQGETITVGVSMPYCCSREDDEEDDEEDDAKSDEENEEGSTPLTVTIAKTNGTSLKFQVDVLPDKIRIQRISFTGDKLHYHGGDPEFLDLDENLQKAFLRYLEVRGINLSATNFLHEYMTEKESKEYIRWLKEVKKFVEA